MNNLQQAAFNKREDLEYLDWQEMSDRLDPDCLALVPVEEPKRITPVSFFYFALIVIVLLGSLYQMGYLDLFINH